MNKVILCFTILSLLTCACKSTQIASPHSDTASTNISDKDHEKITQTIETYFEGWMTGDTSKLGKAMHRTCQLKNIKDDDVVIFDRATYLGFFKPRPRREHAGGEIIAVNITGDIASAKCEIHTEDRLYTDYFNMMKIADQWYIVDKIATNRSRVDK